jgi:hypothetical protein
MLYGLPDLPLPDGNLYLEFFETFDDFSGCGQDGNWDSGTISFQFGTTPPFTGWDETINGGGDAGELPETAQSTGSGALTAIRGEMEADGVDMYAIYISDPSVFSATLRCGALFDTQLFLFDANGRGVVHNDDYRWAQSRILTTPRAAFPVPGFTTWRSAATIATRWAVVAA